MFQSWCEEAKEEVRRNEELAEQVPEQVPDKLAKVQELEEAFTGVLAKLDAVAGRMLQSAG